VTPRLLLLTGPAAGEVAQAISEWKCLGCDLQAEHTCIGFEVRDYGEAVARITQAATDGEHMRRAVEQVIRSIRDGEAWLVGLVLPDPYTGGPDGNPGPRWGNTPDAWVRAHNYLPSGAPTRRLAILAPEPPPLLVERVRAWGGEVWDCSTSPSGDDSFLAWCHIHDEEGGRLIATGTTWPEAVRAALGES